MKTLCELQPGQRACVGGLLSQGGMRRRLMDVGLIEHTEVECLGRSPGGDPAAYLIRGAVIALRRADCAGIVLEEEEGGVPWD